MKDNKDDINRDNAQVKKNLGSNSVGKDLFNPEQRRRTIVIDHMKSLNEMIKVIQMTPMPDALKGLLKLRIVDRMSNFEIALKYGVKLKYIFDIEEEALGRVKDYLKKHHIEDIVEKFNKENSSVKIGDLKTELANPKSEQAATNEGVKDHVNKRKS